MQHFSITPNGTSSKIPAEFIGVLADPETNRPRPAPAWLGTEFAGTPEADALIRSLMIGDAETAQDVIETVGGGMARHFGNGQADWLQQVLPDAHDASWSVSSGPGRSYDRCSVSIRSGIA